MYRTIQAILIKNKKTGKPIGIAISRKSLEPSRNTRKQPKRKTGKTKK